MRIFIGSSDRPVVALTHTPSGFRDEVSPYGIKIGECDQRDRQLIAFKLYCLAHDARQAGLLSREAYGAMRYHARRVAQTWYPCPPVIWAPDIWAYRPVKDSVDTPILDGLYVAEGGLFSGIVAAVETLGPDCSMWTWKPSPRELALHGMRP